MKLSKMNIGEIACYNGDVVKLMNGGKKGGCKYDLYLAFVCDIRDKEQLEREGIDINKLEELIIDTDKVSGID